MYSKVVLNSFLYIPKAEVRDIRRARRLLSVQSKFGGDPIPMYDDGVEWFGVPLYQYKNPSGIAKEVRDTRCDGWDVRIGFKGELWADQEPVIAKFKRLHSHGTTGFILESAPGTGKTVMAIKMMSILNKSTLIVVPRSNLIKQWKERLLEYSDLRKSHIGVAQGGKVSFIGKTVVIGLVHTLSKFVDARSEETLLKYFGCVIFDEVDRSVPPETFAPVVSMFPARYRIGMSATLERADGTHEIFEKHIGQEFLECKGLTRMSPSVIIRKFEGSSGYVHEASPRMNRRGMLISRLAKNPARNMMIARYIAMIVKSDRQCLVLSDRKEQLIQLKWLLMKKFKMKGDDIGFYVSSLPIPKKDKKEKQREKKVSQASLKIASACNVVLATYGMIALGTDIPSLSGLVFATPQSAVKQSQGRIERFQHDKKAPVVVDIVDLHYKDAVQWAEKREEHYIAAGLKVKRYR